MQKSINMSIRNDKPAGNGLNASQRSQANTSKVQESLTEIELL